MHQKTALAFLKSGQNVFLTGSAGTGKTFILNQYIKYCKERKVKIAVTASTGIAATHIDGVTLHSWSGIGIKSIMTTKEIQDLRQKKHLKDNLEKVQVLIIDEVSMLHRKQFELLDMVLKVFKQSAKPFGGVQIILSGDFFQLPPVADSFETDREKFLFMSPSWVEAEFNICYLTEQFRQEENDLLTILNEIRRGDISVKSIQVLETLNRTSESENITKLYTHNVDVDSINDDYLQAIKEPKKKFSATQDGNPKLLETLKKAVITGELLELKIGAKVMFVKNNYERGYINGSLGYVVDYSEKGYPMVRLMNGNRIEAKQEEWKIENEKGSILASFKQIPLRLAWAITVHKSQGMTLDEAEIDLTKTFEAGQGYVALSRLKDIKNLYLKGFNDKALEINPLVRKADARFKELSDILEQKSDIGALEAKAIAFLNHCGALLEPDKNYNKKLEKEKKKSTYEITHELIVKGFKLHEIVKARGLSENTILNHIIEVKKLFPNTDLSEFKPDPFALSKIRKAVMKLHGKTKLDEKTPIKSIFEELDGKIPYDKIKLGLAFLD